MTTMRAAATATRVVVNLYPHFPLAMVREDRERRYRMGRGLRTTEV